MYFLRQSAQYYRSLFAVIVLRSVFAFDAASLHPGYAARPGAVGLPVWQAELTFIHN